MNKIRQIKSIPYAVSYCLSEGLSFGVLPKNGCLYVGPTDQLLKMGVILDKACVPERIEIKKEYEEACGISPEKVVNEDAFFDHLSLDEKLYHPPNFDQDNDKVPDDFDYEDFFEGNEELMYGENISGLKPPEIRPKDIGRQFQDARKAKGYNLEQLAHKAGVPLLAVKMWETGPQSIDVLQRLLGVLGARLVITEKQVILE